MLASFKGEGPGTTVLTAPLYGSPGYNTTSGAPSKIQKPKLTSIVVIRCCLVYDLTKLYRLFGIFFFQAFQWDVDLNNA